MSRNVLIALGVGVVVLGGFGWYLHTRQASPSNPNLYGGNVPAYIGASSFGGPPNGVAGKISGTLQDITRVVQGGDNLLNTTRNAIDDFKNFLA